MMESVRQTGLFSETPAVGMTVDPSLLASSTRRALLSPSWLAACVATLDLPLSRCALLAANNTTLQVCPPFYLYAHLHTYMLHLYLHKNATLQVCPTTCLYITPSHIYMCPPFYLNAHLHT